MALRAVADDRDGLAVEQLEVSVVVVEHRPQAIPTQALGGCHERAPGDVHRAVGGGVGREALRQRRMDLGDLVLGPVEHRVVELAREVERRVPELLEARVAAMQLERLDPHLGEARLLEQLPHSLRAAQREGPRRARGGRLGRGRAPAAPAPGAAPRGCCSIASHTASATRPPGRSTRRVSRSAAERIGHQHVAPAAEHRVDARHRQVDPFGVQHLELDVAQAQRDRALARAREHRLGLVGDDHPAHRRDQLRREHARLAQARRQLEHTLARLRHDRVDHPVRDRSAELAHRVLLARPAGGRLFPALQARVAVGVRVEAHRSSSARRDSSCAGASRRCAAVARRRTTPAWAPCAQRARGAMGAQRLTVERRPRPRHDDRRDGLAPALVGAAEHRRLEHVGMGLEHRLDLGGRDVLAAADDRVGLAPGHAQPAMLVEHAEVAGVQPAVAGERRRARRSARRPGSPPPPAGQRLPPCRSAIRTRVQNSGGPA